MIKIGIIGTGNMGKKHIRNIVEMSNYFQFIGFHDKNEENIEFVKDKYEIPFFGNAEELIESTDALVVAAPSSLHMQYGLQIAEKNKHALIEKPIALTESDSRLLYEKFAEKNKVLMTGHIERYNPAVIEMKKVLDNEEIIAIDAKRCSPYDPRISDTNVIFDLMIHDLDIILNDLYPHRVKYVGAKAVNVKSDNLSDYVQALLQFESGVVATILASKVTEDKIRTIDVHTKNSFVKADLLNKTLLITRKTQLQSANGHSQTYKQEAVVEKVMLPGIEPLKAELIEFANAINQRREGLTSGKDAVNALRFAEWINELSKDCPCLNSDGGK